MKALGKHVLLELYDCDLSILNDIQEIEKSMIAAAEEAGASVVGQVFHQFSPHGVSGVVVIAESHLSIHTWPEHRYAAVDLYTCGNTVDPAVAANVVAAALKSSNVRKRVMFRGLLDNAERITFEPALDKSSFTSSVPERQPIPDEGYYAARSYRAT